MSDLGDAWAEVEAALPKGEGIRVLSATYDGRWEVYAGVPDPAPDDVDYGYGVGKGDGGWGPTWADGDTPTDALRALVARLRE